MNSRLRVANALAPMIVKRRKSGRSPDPADRFG